MFKKTNKKNDFDRIRFSARCSVLDIIKCLLIDYSEGYFEENSDKLSDRIYDAVISIDKIYYRGKKNEN